MALWLIVSGSSSVASSANLSGIRATNGGVPYAGDTNLRTTISPNGDGYRDRALIRFGLTFSATVQMSVSAVGVRRARLFARRLRLAAGSHVVAWKPPAETLPRTYVVRLSVRDGTRWIPAPEPPIVRVLGIEAAFRSESYRPGQIAVLKISSDETQLTLELFHAGVAAKALHADDAVRGEPMGDPVDLRGLRRNGPDAVRVWIGDWPSGLYVARLTAPDGRVGYAPVVVGPQRVGEHRVAVVLPTYTWQAYNFRDENGDGYGDTWYEGRAVQARMGRTYLDRGLPPHFHAYDLNFLVWLAKGEKSGLNGGADFLTDADLDKAAFGLARAYDLIVFPGHHEYVTRREFLGVQRFRNLGGNLMFLSANNFYWRVVRHGRTLTRTRRWRALGRPEAGLIGVQYAASNRGARQAPFVITEDARAAWVFAGTGLGAGSTFGRFGIEIDATAASSPAATVVLAQIRNVIGRRTAQMTYYEMRRGARVFAAGAFTLGGDATHTPVTQILDNLWARLTEP